MEELGKPVNQERREKIHKLVKEVCDPSTNNEIDFQNTEFAFASRSNEELKRMAWLFGMMNKSWLVNIGSKLGLAAIQLRLPFAEKILRDTKKTIHFCIFVTPLAFCIFA